MDTDRMNAMNERLWKMGRDGFSKMSDSDKLDMATEIMMDALGTILNLENDVMGLTSGLYASSDMLRILLPFVKEQQMTAEIANIVELAETFIAHTDILRKLNDDEDNEVK